MGKIAYIVVFNDRDHKSMMYKKYKTLDGLLNIIKHIWCLPERFIVVSLRIYEVEEEGDET